MPVRQFLLPVLVLMLWTVVMWLWLYLTRVPAMRAARIHPDAARHPGSGWKQQLPARTQSIADNYNHLHEQPTVFYALMIVSVLADTATPLAYVLAWTYVGLRIVHSLVQTLSSRVLWRFAVFALASLALIALLAHTVLLW